MAESLSLTPEQSKFLSRYLARKWAAGIAAAVLGTHERVALLTVKGSEHVTVDQIREAYRDLVKRLTRQSRIPKPPKRKRRSRR